MAEQSKQTQGTSSAFILKTEEHFGVIYDSTYSLLSGSAASHEYRVLRPYKPDTGKRYLLDSENRTVATLILDVPATEPANVPVLSRVKSYVREGGLGSFVAGFSSSIPIMNTNKAWKNDWGLDWRFGNYIRIDMRLNR
jgi:hypothetical protein